MVQRVGVIIVFLIAATVGGFWLWQQPLSPSAPTGLTVAATILPLADIVQNVAGENVAVVQLIPTGASPHSYNLAPQDLGSLQDAKTLFAIGHGLDDWSAGPAAGSVGVPVTIVDADIALREFGEHEHEAGSIDPHYWLTVPNAKMIASTVSDTLMELDPVNAAAYQANLAAYHRELDQLEADLQQQATQARQKHFIAMHDAWSYFAAHYGFELVATYEPSEGKEPSVSDLNHIGEVAKQYNITTFYAEPQKHSSSAINFLAKEFGLTIKVLDPEGSTAPGSGSYADLMRYNMAQLVGG